MKQTFSVLPLSMTAVNTLLCLIPLSRVNTGLNPPKIASKGFIVLSDSADHGEFHKKSP